MEKDFDKMLQEMVHGYRTKCSEDARLLEEAVESREAVLLYPILFEKANLQSLTTNEKLLHSMRLFYFMGYCMKYNNGIPMIEVLSDWIDNHEKRKVINAVKSQSNLFDVLVEQGVDIKILADYIEEREMIEYAIDEEKKSTGVLKRILERKKTKINKEVHSKSTTLDSIKESYKYEEKIRVTKIASEEDVERLRNQGAKDIVVGQQFTYLPEPTNKEELFERFIKLHAQRYFETLQYIFREKYGNGNKKIIEEELSALNSFIDKANQLSTKETFQNKWVERKLSDLHEYSRLANGYYQNPNMKFYPSGYFNSNAFQVYAQYFLYKKWLESELLKYFTEQLSQPQQEEIKTKPALSVPDWCIIFYYLDEAGNQQGAKIDRMIKFITDNDIRNSNRKLTTKGSFKKQYYEIYHRINGTENSKGEKLPPLPPERIKNILHFLKKNENALQTAENDIAHLISEMKENKKNDY